MDTGKAYYDTEGNECSIWQMVKREPTWAAVRIQEGEKAIEEIARLRAEVEALKEDAERLDLLENSEGDGHFYLTRLDHGSKLFDVEAFYGGIWLQGSGKTLRAAIDVARGKDNG